MNEKNIKALLKGIGLADSILTEIEKDDADVKTIITTFNDSQKEHFKPLIENEITPDIEQRVKAETEGKILGTLNNDIKKFGVPLETIKDVPVHKKLQVLKDAIESKAAKPDETVKALQEENVTLKNQVAEWEGKLTSEVEKGVNAERSKVQSRLIDLDLNQKYQSISPDKILGKKHSPGILLALKSHIATKYDLSVDENEKIVPFEKGTQKRAQGKNADGKEYFVPIEDLLLTSLKELNLSVESNGGERSGQQGQGSGGNGQKEKSKRLLEMEAKINQG